MTNIKFLTAGALALTLAAPAVAQTAIIGYDVDGDGMLTGAEFRDVLDKASVFPSLDVDGDGTLSEAEFAAYYDGLEVSEDGTPPKELAEYDTDGDGVLDSMEYSMAFMAGYDLNADGAIDADELVDLENDLSDDIRFNNN